MGRRTERINRGVLWGAGVVAVALLALTAYAFLFGGGGSDDTSKQADKNSPGPSASPTQPAPTYTDPDDWTEPEKWAALPRGTRTDHNGNLVGFPHTTDGAVAALADANSTDVEGSHSTVDEQLGNLDSYISSTDRSAERTAAVKEAAAKTDKKLRADLGLPATGDMPSGAYARTHVIGFKIIKKSGDEVSAYLLSRFTSKAGETAAEHGSYTRTVLAARWEAGDWKMSTAAISRAAEQTQGADKPAIVAPGDAAFNTAGWTAIREAS